MAALLPGVIGGNAVADEIYKWTDENGVVHFDDRPPQGQNTQTIDIPPAPLAGSAEPKPSPNDTQPGNDNSAANAPNAPGEEDAAPLSLADQRRAQLATDRENKRETREEMERMCEQRRKRLTQMEPARRVFYTDEDGQSVRMDDDLRVDLIEEDKVFIAKNCK